MSYSPGNTSYEELFAISMLDFIVQAGTKGKYASCLALNPMNLTVLTQSISPFLFLIDATITYGF